MKTPGSFKALIFDFNGVLFWDDQLQRRSWRVFAKQLRPEPVSDQEIDQHFHGRNGHYTLEYLLGEPISSNRAAHLLEQKETIYRQMCLDLGEDFRLSPGALPLLDELIQHQIPHTIATASAWNNLEFFVQHLHLKRWFDVQKIVYNNGQIAGKPAPDLYLEAASRLDRPPEDCLVVEDSHSGIQAAHAAGIGWVIALGPPHSHAQLARLPGVDQVIVDLRQIDCQEIFGKGVSPP